MVALDLPLGPQVIENHGQIVSILNRLQRERALLTVRVPGFNQEFRSAVLTVDGRQRIVTLDELHPERGHELVGVDTELRILSRTNGIETRFQLRVAAVGIENGVYYYTTALPDEILYHQRRQFVRVPVRLTLQRRCRLSDNERAIDIHLSDLSAGGFGAYVRDGAEIRRGETLRFEIELEGIEPLTGEVEIRHIHQDKAHRRLLMGTRFTGLQPRERSRIGRLVTALQRELLRST